MVGYWAERDIDKARELGAVGAAGDLFVDGALGSHTACLHQPYADAGHTGTAYLDATAVAAHVTACTEAGLQAGFHAIGDAAVTAVVEGVRIAAEKWVSPAVRAARHRVEHAEMLTPETIAAFAELGLTASVQPAFDALWGGEDGMYARARAPERARTLNPFAALLRAGVPLAFGSDSPVTPLDPWGTVRAAAFHRTPEHRVSVRAAFTAHTRGGWRAVGRDDAGVLVPGAPADYAVWRTGELVVQAPDDRVARWSTDPGSGTPGLPDLTPGATCPSACAPWLAAVRSSCGRASDPRGWRGRGRAPDLRRATCASTPLTRRSNHIAQVKRLLTDGRRKPVGSAGSTTGRPTGELPAARVSAAGSGTVCRTGAPSTGARPSAGLRRERSGRPGRCDPAGPGRSVDNGLSRSVSGIGLFRTPADDRLDVLRLVVGRDDHQCRAERPELPPRSCASRVPSPSSTAAPSSPYADVHPNGRGLR
ncbi:hypothetical protein SALBM311S_05252 [Streptomyces alboniger]